MAQRGKGTSRKGDTHIGNQLNDLRARMDHLELQMLDFNGDESERVIDRMHHLEEQTRENCRHLLQIMAKRGALVGEQLETAEIAAQQAERQCKDMECKLRRRGDLERQEASVILRELKEAIVDVDIRASVTVQRLQRFEDEVKQQRSEVNIMVRDQLSEVSALVDEVRSHSEAT